MQDVKEEIKARLPIEDVVGQYIELKRAGRSLKGRSPWGVDKTPSFMVSPEKGIWHDFSANKGGDVIKFVMEVDGLSYREALEKLAAQAGVDISKYSGDTKEMSRRKVRAREALELTTKYYQFCLTKNKPVLDYVFYKRNLNRKTVEEFRIGYAPQGGKVLTEFLSKKGYAKQELNDAGLLNRFNGDMFRGRMTVPFIDVAGNVIGFTARILGQGEPKYLNTPETILFNKSRFIFGLYQAKEAIRRSNFVVVVEGNMDVISSHQAGVKEAVATSGTAMTEQHLKNLAKLTNDVRLAYDGDEAGVNATERVIKMVGDLDLDINLSVVDDYHGAKDPDELIQKDAKLWQEAVAKTKPAIEWLLKKYENGLDLATEVGKKKYSDVAVRLLKNIKDEIVKADYEKMVARKLDVAVEDLRGKSERLAQKIAQKSRFLKKAKTTLSQTEINELLKMENSLAALKMIGGVDVELPFEIDKADDNRIEELKMVFEVEHEKVKEDGMTTTALATEAKELLLRYLELKKKLQIRDLTAELNSLDEDDEKYDELLHKIKDLQKR